MLLSKLVFLVAASSGSAWAQQGEPAAPVVTGPPERPRHAERVAVGFDVVPGLGTSGLAHGDDVRLLSFGLGGTLAGGIHGVEASSGFAVTRHDVRGVQASAGFNVVGGRVHGVQGTGGVNVVGGQVEGVQGAGGFNIAGEGARGVQGAGGFNIVGGDAGGVQAAGGFNVAGSVSGVQVAPLNVAGDVRGVQVGVLNIARTSDLSLGLVSIVTEGRTHLDGWTNERGFANLALVHGGARWHNLYGVGWRPFGEEPVVSAMLGFGLHNPLGERLFADLDALGAVEHASPGTLGSTATLRLNLGLRLLPRLALTAGPSYNLGWVAACPCSEEALPPGMARLYAGDGVELRGWPGFSLGVRAL